MQSNPETIPELKIDEISPGVHDLRLTSLLDSCFSVPAGSHFFDDFPVWNPVYKNPSALRLGVFDPKNQLVSTTSVRLAHLRAGDGNRSARIPIAIIGAVATLPNWRGSGLASNTVTLAIQWAKENGASLVMLWGSEHAMYQKLGLDLCGVQVRIPVSELGLSLNPPKRKIKSGWDPTLFPLIRSRSDGLELTEDDRSWFEAHLNVDWHFIEESGKPLAYVAIGRGIDLTGIIHEWGGDRAALLELLGFVLKKNGGAQLLGAPWHFEKLGVPRSNLDRKAQFEFLCLARVLDPARLIRGFHPKLVVRAQESENRWTVSLPSEELVGLTDRELTQKCLGSPANSAEGKSAFLPLPLWVWGLDAS